MMAFALPRKNREGLQGVTTEVGHEVRLIMVSDMAEVIGVALNQDRTEPAKSRGQESL